MSNVFCTHHGPDGSPLIRIDHVKPPKCVAFEPLLNALQVIWEELSKLYGSGPARFWICFEIDPDCPQGVCVEDGLIINLARVEEGMVGVRELAHRFAHELAHLHRWIIQGIAPRLENGSYTREDEAQAETAVSQVAKTTAWIIAVRDVSAYLQQQGSG